MAITTPAIRDELLIIETARTEKAINKAAQEGFVPLVKAVTPGRNIHGMYAVYQHYQNGRDPRAGGLPMASRSSLSGGDPFTLYYPYRFRSPFAAYLVPKGLTPGTRVWLKDIIEDIVAVWGTQGYNERLNSGEAVWNGTDFKILFDPVKDAPQLVG